MPARESPPLSSYLWPLLAVATGFSVATIYLNQTILGSLGQVFGQSPARIGLISTVTQLGYAAGIFFLVPLGDIVSKKKLAVIKLLLLSTALGLIGFAHSLEELFLGSLGVGILGSVAQDFVPLAAELAPPESRGRSIGIVMSGLLVGILCSRTASGFIETSFGWRWVFWSFGIAITAFAVLAMGVLPKVKPGRSSSYANLLASIGGHLASKPLLRSSLRTHGLVGFAFSAFWTNLSFALSGEPFHLSSLKIGLFGLAGAAGALVAPIAGKLSDVRGPRFGIQLGVSAVAIAFLFMLAVPGSLVAILVGTVLFDAGTQMSLISHQTIIYALDERSKSSLNAVFITGLFLSFALGSAVSTQVESAWGWRAVLSLALGASILAWLSARAAPTIARS